ncbi:MAG: hypothetical protein ACPLKS_07610 [Caldisericum exile]|uniref:hypothetical protein n=1 Tax=Caldisericum exile TaxID=693075 RepID=UPI003C7949C1
MKLNENEEIYDGYTINDVNQMFIQMIIEKLERIDKLNKEFLELAEELKIELVKELKMDGLDDE